MDKENKPKEDRLKVVIAEDEAIIRLDLKEVLEVEGYEVVATASDGKMALEKITELKPDIAILDIKIPELDGISVATAVSSYCAVVILTAFSQKDLVSKAIAAGAQAYLVKPFEQNELRAALELAVVRFRESQALQMETQELSERLENRKIIDKAKGILMDELKCNEADAFSLIQKRAMNVRSTMKLVATQILEGNLNSKEISIK